MPAKVFFSYAHADQALRDELAKHLAVMKRNGDISDWYDRDINAGAVLDEKISEALESSEIVLCLVSPDFLASRYCYEREMKRALERRRAGDCEVLPVILRPSDWLETPLAALRATPTDGKPVTSHSDRDAAFVNVTADIRRVAKSFSLPFSRPPTDACASSSPAAAPPLVAGIPSRSRFRRGFTDAERDAFLEAAFEQIAEFVEAQTALVHEHAPHLEGRFSRIDARTFTAAIYESGKRAATGSIWHDGRTLYYSNQANASKGSYNESLSVDDDGFELHFKPLGMSSFRLGQDPLAVERAADYLWDLMTSALRS